MKSNVGTIIDHIWERTKANLYLPFLAVISALLIGSIVMVIVGYNPLVAYQAMFLGACGSKGSLSETLLKTIPLLFTGIGVAIAFKGRSFNIGAEGQFYMGALVVSWLGVVGKGIPAFLFIPMLLIVAFITGALYGALPGYLKARVGASEIVTTVMLNSIAIQLVSYMVQGPLQEPRHFYPETAEILNTAKLGIILPGTRLHAGLLLALLAAVLCYLLLYKTVLGYQIRAVGANAEAAEYAGINVKRNIVTTMALSGGLAGLAGAVEVMGVTWKLYQNISPGYGYTAIAVALLARENPLAVILSALLFGALNTGSNMMARSVNVPSVLSSLVQSLVIFFVVGYSVFEYKFAPNHKRSIAREEGLSV
ncbi:Branched-chain amino acid transport system / permease component [Neomoorella glycerini]|uniref:Branched-chain amino acid transport system / permease component n=1 Tax=Neomoorella glycerini TaxID=55779 RepID=A0A6I5ZRF9_9FIRM|nr:ABC transporter permease [Moorella glycerini]QGP92582.1 Branched-chain amino acid transport system / permease component [Moorella glycerini]